MIKSVYKGSCIFVNQHFSGMFRGIDLEWDKELEDALRFTGLGITPIEVTIFAWTTGLFLFILFFIGALITLNIGFNPAYTILAGVILAGAALYLIPQYPARLILFERMKSLGYAPKLIAYLVITLKQDPNIEKATKFAAEHGEDKLAEDLRRLLWETWSGKYNSIDEALPLLGHKWGEHIKGLRDALYAIRTSQMERYEHRRLDTLDRTLNDLLDNIETKFREFTEDLRAPTAVLFMSGVLIPLVAVIFLPAISMLGFTLATPECLSIGLFMIILSVFMFSEFILAKRPIAFSPIKISRNYPGLPSPGKIKIGNRECSLIKFSFGIAALISTGSIPYLLGFSDGIWGQLNTLPLVIGVGTGLWIYLRWDALPRLKARNEIEQAEEDTIEASFHIGNRLMTGTPAEEALIRVSRLLSNPKEKSRLGGILEDTARNIRYMNLTLDDAFFHPEKGSLKDVHSGLIRSIFKMFVNSMKRGIKPGAETLIASANHFRDIKKVENSLREKVSYTTSMMKMSVTIIAPALCALAIPLIEIFIKVLDIQAGTMEDNTIKSLGVMMLQPPSLTPDVLTLIIGAYMLLLLIILVRFTTILEYGNDEIKIKMRTAEALPKALIIFICVLSLGRFFFAQMI